MSRKNKLAATISLDIAILTAGRVDLFEKCVDTLLPLMKPEYRIHVWNNGSNNDEYEQIYKKLPHNSKVIKNRQNLEKY